MASQHGCFFGRMNVNCDKVKLLSRNFKKLMEYNSFYLEFLETVRHPAASLFVGYIGPFHFDNSLLLKVLFDLFHNTHHVFLSGHVVHVCRVIWVVSVTQRVPDRAVYLSVNHRGGLTGLHGQQLVGVTQFLV